ncbi:MAG: selenocysteine-specific translation factor, partial [Deltaproteobacteria bacterium]|nr:selenocysteine-specific translation factor [Deltaproteobacteria bacterium]
MEICQLLKIQYGLVVLTKVDMVESDWLELVKEDLTEFLSDTFLENAPMLEVSAVTGEGMDSLMQVLDNLVKDISERETGNFFRLPVDRVFTMKGFGTVITGTTISGSIKIGDEATIYPEDIPSKVRGIQVHNQEVNEVRAGLRTAINLQGIEKAQIKRGDIIATRDALRSTFMLDVLLDLLPSAPKKLKNRAKARFHGGTAEIIATVVLLDKEELDPGQSCFAQIRLDSPTAVLPHDRFVLRSYSPVRAIGGGEILNAYPQKKKRFSEKAIAELRIMKDGSLSDITEQCISMGQFRGVGQDDLPFLTNAGKKKLDEVLKVLMAQKKVIQFDKENNGFIHSDHLNEIRNEVLSALTKYHQDFPLKVWLS